MLRRGELARWAAAFGVADEQIRRDHLISHVLGALSAMDGPGLVFYGGTAGWRPPGAEFDHMPAETRASWAVDLAHQMATVLDPDVCLAQVHAAWAATGGT